MACAIRVFFKLSQFLFHYFFSLQGCTPQSVFILSTTQVNFFHPLYRPADSTAFPIKRSNTYITSLRLPLAICKRVAPLLVNIKTYDLVFYTGCRFQNQYRKLFIPYAGYKTDIENFF